MRVKAIALTTALLVSGCATELTTAGQGVRIVTETQRQQCRFLQLITVRVGIGPDKPGSALKAAINEAATAGGNGLYLVTNAVHWLDGASVAGEALRCP